MLTVDKLVNSMEYEEKRKTEMLERRNKLMFDLPIFNDISNENEWNEKKQEIKKQKELDIVNNALRLEKKKEELQQKIENDKKERQMKIPIFSDIKNENEWQRKRRKQRIQRTMVQDNRMMSKEQRKEITNKEVHKKVLKYKELLQKHHELRFEKHIHHINKEFDKQDKHTKLIEWYEKEKEEQMKRLQQRENKNVQNSKMLEWYEKEKEEQMKRLQRREEMDHS